ncbi:ATP-binding protein [Chakrabartyella piscis]|uniref:ATP-binding protein n=1 Tax=Chakrabartyella piscis TaxID=2918914 RepID=UPI002958A85A|nr:4Fe-4S binding protein [Chakrabartyella piscis]
MSRKVIQIDEEKCVGCGLCANACQQSAIAIVNGKAKMMHDDYCDGLGNCLPVCPVNAISFSDKDVVNLEPKSKPVTCPGTLAAAFDRKPVAVAETSSPVSSMLQQWPVQIKLVSETAPYFHQAHLLVAADCTAFAYGNFHGQFMKNKVTIIGCPKLDAGDYIEKLTSIIQNNDIKSLTVVRMEVPCCGGIEHAAVTALKNSGKFIPWQVHTISIKGELLEQ